MNRYPSHLDVRVTVEEKQRFQRIAEACGMRASDLLRVLLQLPSDIVGGGSVHLVVVDTVTATKLMREMRHWGYQLNQIAHAFNAIAYYLRRNDMDSDDVVEQLQAAQEKVDRMALACDYISMDAPCSLASACCPSTAGSIGDIRWTSRTRPRSSATSSGS